MSTFVRNVWRRVMPLMLHDNCSFKQKRPAGGSQFSCKEKKYYTQVSFLQGSKNIDDKHNECTTVSQEMENRKKHGFAVPGMLLMLMAFLNIESGFPGFGFWLLPEKWHPLTLPTCNHWQHPPVFKLKHKQTNIYWSLSTPRGEIWLMGSRAFETNRQ